MRKEKQTHKCIKKGLEVKTSYGSIKKREEKCQTRLYRKDDESQGQNLPTPRMSSTVQTATKEEPSRSA